MRCLPMSSGKLRGLGRYALAVCVLVLVAGCGARPRGAPRQIVLQQTWELEAGEQLAGHLVMAGLGDVSVQLRHRVVRAPFAGQVERATTGVDCVYFSTPEVPAYLFRYCGLSRPRLGDVAAGAVIGRGTQAHFATLRRQPDGTWAIVEPSASVLEKSLSVPQGRGPGWPLGWPALAYA